MTSQSASPKEIAQHSPTEMLIVWSTDERYAVPFFDLRFLCPCAGCVDENTGKRTLKRENIKADIKPRDAQLVGRYAVQINWNDGHSTGMYHYENLYKICEKSGLRLG